MGHLTRFTSPVGARVLSDMVWPTSEIPELLNSWLLTSIF